MVMEDDGSCGSNAYDSFALSPSPTQNQQKMKLEVYDEVLRRLKDSCNEEATHPGFHDDLWAHFNRLPTRYALDVNVERSEDVLMHKRLLQLAQDPENRPVIDVHLVQVPPSSEARLDSIDSESVGEKDPLSSANNASRKSIHPPPAFGSSPNLEALALETSKPLTTDVDSPINADTKYSRPMHEVTFSTVDKPKLLSQLTFLLSETGLNIQEAHAFSTTDGYSLDVFVVDGWPYEETERLTGALKKEALKIEKRTSLSSPISSNSSEHERTASNKEVEPLSIPNDGSDVWEIDRKHLKFDNMVASGSYNDLFKGSYCSQDVAIKVLKSKCINSDLQKEFAQEVYIMRKVRHKNVVQFIGALTKLPTLCIVTEFISGGSVHDYLHKQRGVFKLPTLIKIAIDVSKGMSYLHQNNIIHRDLKSANILMGEKDIAKVADFGVARVKARTGVMTAETGTYRWMAPEVVEHKPYDQKADVYSFGIVLWECLTGKIPYQYMTPLQAATGVVQNGLRPSIPKNTHPKLVELLKRCWQQDPSLRPDFSEIIEILQKTAKEVGAEGDDRRKEKSGGILSVLKRNL